jgi:ankyrin repeat protein
MFQQPTEKQPTENWNGKEKRAKQRANEMLNNLIRASQDGDTEKLNEALNNGVDVNAKSSRWPYGWTALHHAIQQEHSEIAKMLLDAGADMNATIEERKYDPGYDPAYDSGYKNDGMSVLDMAINYERIEILKMLFAAGADVNKTIDSVNNTFLHFASLRGKLEMVKMLLDAGADVNAKNDDGETAIDLAKSQWQTPTVKLLEKAISHHSHQNIRVVRAAARSGKTDMPASGKRIFSWAPGQGPNPGDFLGGKRKTRKSKKSNKKRRKTRSKRQRGGTINEDLIRASKDGDTNAVRILIDEEGADVTATDSNGWTALMWASRNGYTEIVTMLLEEGADVHEGFEHFGNIIFVPLQGAIENGHAEIVRILINHGANVNDQYTASPMNTPLTEAASRGYTEIVAILLDRRVYEDGAAVEAVDMDAKNGLGKTALDIAIENGHNGIVELLRGGELKTPQCMSQADFDTCTPDEKGIPQCGIMMTELTKENAVRTHPPPPHKEGEEPNTTNCFDRESLRRWLITRKENPITKLPVEQAWIDANMGKKKCEPQTESAPETVFNIPSKGGKRKTKKSKRKSKKSNRKTRRR